MERPLRVVDIVPTLALESLNLSVSLWVFQGSFHGPSSHRLQCTFVDGSCITHWASSCNCMQHFPRVTVVSICTPLLWSRGWTYWHGLCYWYMFWKTVSAASTSFAQFARNGRLSPRFNPFPVELCELCHSFRHLFASAMTVDPMFSRSSFWHNLYFVARRGSWHVVLENSDHKCS